MCQKYNGFTNYETWCFSLYHEDFFDEQARDIYQQAEEDRTFSKKQNAAIALAEIMEETVFEFAPEVDGMYHDILFANLESINFYQVAEITIDSIKEEL